jgi:FdhE protein
MTIDIQALIDQRPHLKDPLELFAKLQRFQEEAVKLLPKPESAVSSEEAKAYPRESVGPIFKLFVSIFNLPGEELEPLHEALENGDIDFMQFSIDKIPTISSLPYSKEEQAGILFLLSRPYFLALRETFQLDGREWENGRCPLCSAQAALASIVEGPQRRLHCSFCGTTGTFKFIGCPSCGCVDTEKLSTILSEDEPGFRISTCDECKSYVKVMEHPIIKDMSIDLADMASLPLDIVAQGKGYARMAPNPISLKKMA